MAGLGLAAGLHGGGAVLILCSPRLRDNAAAPPLYPPTPPTPPPRPGHLQFALQSLVDNYGTHYIKTVWYGGLGEHLPNLATLFFKRCKRHARPGPNLPRQPCASQPGVLRGLLLRLDPTLQPA